jgi:protein-tyrosine-phosphatase
LDKFDVVVALDAEARKVFQARSRRLVCLDWPLQDPLALPDGQPAKREAIEASCTFLKEHIQALVRAILGEQGPARQA